MSLSFTQIASYDNYLLANMTLGLLQENFINCHLKDEYIVTIDPLLNPAVGGIKLMVAADQFDRATALIAEAEQAYLAGIKCPHCKQTSLKAIEKINQPTGIWGRLKNILAYGQEVVRSKKYQCLHCGCSYLSLPAATDD